MDSNSGDYNKGISNEMQHERRAKIDLRDDQTWRGLAEPSWDQKASWQIAKWILVTFVVVICLSFLLGAIALTLDEKKFELSMDLIKQMLGVTTPLVTLAVGYYLGSREAK